MTSPDHVTRFWSLVEVHLPATLKCWPWLGPMGETGPRFYAADRYWSAMRLAWILTNRGRWPKGKVLRICWEQETCINPMHIDGVAQ